MNIFAVNGIFLHFTSLSNISEQLWFRGAFVVKSLPAADDGSVAPCHVVVILYL